MRKIADETNAGVLIVEQHVDLALDVSDRAYVMTRGEIALEGTVAEFRAQPDRLEACHLGVESSS